MTEDLSGAGRPGVVVVSVDGSLSSRAAPRHAIDEAEQRVATLRVVSAYEPPELWALAYGEPLPTTPSGVPDSPAHRGDGALAAQG